MDSPYAWRFKDWPLRWKINIVAFLVSMPIMLSGATYVFHEIYWLEVKTALNGLMNFVDAKQHGVIRFLGQNIKQSQQLAQLTALTDENALRQHFRNIVTSDIFKLENHAFREEITAGTRIIPTWQVYHAIDWVKDGRIIVSSDPAREGRNSAIKINPPQAYSEVYREGDTPLLTFGAPTPNGGTLLVHADARMLTLIVNGEIGNLESGMGVFYLAGVGRTFDFYMVNRDNLMITESRQHPDALLKMKGSEHPWKVTQQARELNIVCSANGTYTTNARCITGCRETMGFYEENGIKTLGVSMPFYDSGWTIVVEQEADELLGPLWQVGINLMAVTVLLLSLGFLVFMRMANKHIVRPLTRLTGSIRHLAIPGEEIDTSTRYDTGNGDEVGDIARAFDGLLAKLEETSVSRGFFNQVIENLSNALFVVDNDNRIVLVNHAAIELAGRSRAALTGESLDSLIHCSRKPLSDSWYSCNCMTEIGETIPISCSSAPLSRGRVVVVTDQREQVRIRQEIEQAKIEAEQASRAKSSFLIAMSHEIRTPMNGVIGMIDVMQQSKLRPEQAEMAEIIHESAFSLLAIIDDILDFSKIEAGKLELERAPLDLTRVVESACDMLDTVARKKGVELTLFTDPAIPAQVLGDATRIRQILVNLVGNAIKFSSGTGRLGRVSLRAVLAERHGDRTWVEFHVSDNGIGMDDAAMARLFTSFNQADTSTTRRFGGTGLGLAISKRLCTLSGGEIKVQSQPDHGSTFTVRLPFDIASSQPKAEEYEFDLAGISCLVIGGPDSLAGDLATYLRHAAMIVECAPDLATAQRQIGGHAPGIWVWVIDVGPEHPHLDDLRAACHARQGLDTHFVVVEHELPQDGPEHPCNMIVIERGKRRQPRVKAPDLVTLDGEVMHHKTFLRAVALAAGKLDEPESIATALPAAAVAPPHSDKLILVAEDNETNQKVIQRQLTLLGYVSEIAGDGRAALERWRSGKYALLLTDLHMPEMDGYQLTATIRAEEPASIHAPIIALTANALKGEADHCRASGMDDYLSKPVQLKDLREMLDKWLSVADHRGAGATNPAPPPLQGEGCQSSPTPAGEGTAVVPLDVNVLAALVGDDAETLDGFLRDFRRSAENIVAELQAAFAARDAAQAGALAHKLKSSARTVGALPLGELCFAMEQAGKSGNLPAFAQLLPQFEREFARVIDCLNSREH